MGAIATLDALIAAATDSTLSENIFAHNTGRVNSVAGTTPTAAAEISFWLFDGHPGGAGTPSSLIYPTNDTSGGLQQADPGGGRQKWLMGFSGVIIDGGTLMLYDRLAQQGGLSSSSTSNQSVASTITRYTSGIGNQLWLEISTAASSPATTTFHFDYTDENSASATTPEIKIGAANFNGAQRVFRASLALSGGAGGRGVKNMTNFKLNANSGTSGDYCAVIAHPLAMVPMNLPAIGALRNWMQGVFPQEILTDACLGLVYIPQNTVNAVPFVSLHMIEA